MNFAREYYNTWLKTTIPSITEKPPWFAKREKLQTTAMTEVSFSFVLQGFFSDSALKASALEPPGTTRTYPSRAHQFADSRRQHYRRLYF
jgi:hypothetical protein